MRRFLPYLALAGLVLGGCALSDYPALPAGWEAPNAGHGVFSCYDDDKIANTQQQYEPMMMNTLEYVVPGSCSTVVGLVWLCAPTGTPVSAADAKAWGRFIGAWSFVTEAQSTGGAGPGYGHWAMGGMLDLPNGDRRLTTWYRWIPSVDSRWSCAASTNLRGRYGAAEGHVVGDPLVRTEGHGFANFGIETVAIDSQNGFQWSANVFAATPARIGYGYSTMNAMGGRGYEGHLTHGAVPKWHDGLAEFFAGESITVEHRGATFTGSGSVNEDGMITVSFESVTYNGSTFTPSAPIQVSTNRDLTLFEFDRGAQEAQVLELAQWAVESGTLDQPIQVGGFIPELGVYAPERALDINKGLIERWLVSQSGSINPRERDRLR
jgi:hypothetical protein